jgi:hypothetical protein
MDPHQAAAKVKIRDCRLVLQADAGEDKKKEHDIAARREASLG